jgi:uncharacterized membrane-anchored protein YjiN (DUF445 family)
MKRRNRIGLISLLVGAAGYAFVILQPWFPLQELVLVRHLTLKSLLVAFFDASLVGALADWFAVSALFRNPLGVSLPHTDILAKNKDSIAEAVPRFLTGFVSEEEIASELSEVDFAGKILQLVRQSDTGWGELHVFLQTRVSPILSRQGVHSATEGVRILVSESLTFLVERLDAAAIFSRVLAWTQAHGYDDLLIERAAERLRNGIAGNAARLAQSMTPVIKRNAGWQGLFISQGTVEKLLRGIQDELAQMRSNPQHELRVLLKSKIKVYGESLASGPSRVDDRRESFSAFVKGIVTRQEFVDGCVESVSSLLNGIGVALSDPESDLFHALKRIEQALERHIEGNVGFARGFNHTLAELVAGLVARSRLIENLTGYLATLLKNADERDFVRRVEESVWNDLQYIRLNGAVVGGIVGLALAIFAAFV